METPAKRKKDPAKSETQKPKQEKSGASNDLTYKSNQMPAPEYGENRTKKLIFIGRKYL